VQVANSIRLWRGQQKEQGAGTWWQNHYAFGGRSRVTRHSGVYRKADRSAFVAAIVEGLRVETGLEVIIGARNKSRRIEAVSTPHFHRSAHWTTGGYPSWLGAMRTSTESPTRSCDGDLAFQGEQHADLHFASQLWTC
jgi:hypothetical protein